MALAQLRLYFQDIFGHNFHQVLIFVIIPEFTFFDVQHKFTGMYAIKFGHSSFGVTPKSFYAVHMAFTASKFIVTMKYSVVIIAIDYQPIIGFPAVRINNRIFQNLAFNDGQSLFFGAMPDNS
jgi:hypothetical protein